MSRSSAAPDALQAAYWRQWQLQDNDDERGMARLNALVNAETVAVEAMPRGKGGGGATQQHQQQEEGEEEEEEEDADDEYDDNDYLQVGWGWWCGLGG